MKRQKQLKQLEAIDADIVEYLKKFLVSSTVEALFVIQPGMWQNLYRPSDNAREESQFPRGTRSKHGRHSKQEKEH